MTLDLYKNIGKNLRAIRYSKKISPVEIAKALDISVSTLTTYESGTRRINLEYILKLCKIYEISVNDIIPTDEKTPTGRELVQEMKFLEELKSLHFSSEEQQLILDFSHLIIKGRSVNIGESYDQRQE